MIGLSPLFYYEVIGKILINPSHMVNIKRSSKTKYYSK